MRVDVINLEHPFQAFKLIAETEGERRLLDFWWNNPGVFVPSVLGGQPRDPDSPDLLFVKSTTT